MELESIMQESIEVLEKDFYNRKFFYSYSSLNKLIWNPQIFYQMYVLGLKEEKLDAHLVQGKLIHLLLLEPEKFEKEFMMTPSTLPSGNLRVVVDRVFKHYTELSRNGDDRTELAQFDGAILDVNKAYGLKGIIDNLVIDHDKKIIYVNDIKTTSKDLKDFPETIEYYSYWLQAIIYMIIVNHLYGDLTGQGYQTKFHFVVIDRTFQSYAFPVSEETLNKWLDRFQDCIAKAEWHYKNRSYELPYDFAKGLVVL